jgi:ATP-dependent Lhr-like helicase
VSAFDRLHPALQHHIVNSLGWRGLRPLQEQSIAPVLDGHHALLVGPTAGGKTEAAFFPVLSRVLEERWAPLSVLYLCPLRALLNDLQPRLWHYANLVGRRVAMWHGDVGEGERKRILADPPDVLLTTPESLELMLISPRVEHERLFASVRAVVVDEVHAFAADDRGWHLLSVLERVARLAGREVQRIGLSATVGNPDAIIAWLVASGGQPRVVVVPGDGRVVSAEATADFVGSLENAGTVIARMHAGEKRLVFADSRARVEDLAAALRKHGVQTFVSHSSISADERRQAEHAFATGSDCVIVATSTLELGIDVGDLDRVIQIDAPAQVASFLQRLGRTGRRPGTTRNCLFLATEDEALVRAVALCELWASGFVEQVRPPADPVHLLAQQVMALSLQEGGIGASDWSSWIGGMPGFAALDRGDVEATLRFMLAERLLFEDSGVWSIGPEGEAAFGRRHFIDLLSAFTSEPLFTVKHGELELGRVHHASFAVRDDRPPVLLLAGRAWVVNHVDWEARAAYVEPTKEDGRSRWLGSGQALRFELCQAIAAVLGGRETPSFCSKRAAARLAEVRAGFGWLVVGQTALVTESNGRIRWWTFGGLHANAALAAGLRSLGANTARLDNFSIGLEADLPPVMLRKLCEKAEAGALWSPVDERAVTGLKFNECLPPDVAERMLSLRMTDQSAIRAVLAQPFERVTRAVDTNSN